MERETVFARRVLDGGFREPRRTDENNRRICVPQVESVGDDDCTNDTGHVFFRGSPVLDSRFRISRFNFPPGFMP